MSKNITDLKDLTILGELVKHRSLREIGAVLGNSQTAVRARIGWLVKAGYVAQDTNKQHSYIITNKGLDLLAATKRNENERIPV